MSSKPQVRLEDGFEGDSTENYTTTLSSSVALRVYSNTKPCNLKIAKLQKGLVFVYKGVEQIGEGAGFGLPVLLYKNETCFSGSSIVTVFRNCSSTRIRKEYFMDRIARSKFRHTHIHNEEIRALLRFLGVLYQKNRYLRFLSLRKLALNLGIESVYIETQPAGKLVVTYDIRDRVVNVKVEYDQIDTANLLKVFILNEQSAKFFRKYADAAYIDITDGKIGAWEPVKSEWACLLDKRGAVGYRLWDVENCVLRRGRESMDDFLDWVGLDYELSPLESFFEYRIEMLGVNG